MLPFLISKKLHDFKVDEISKLNQRVKQINAEVLQKSIAAGKPQLKSEDEKVGDESLTKDVKSKE